MKQLHEREDKRIDVYRRIDVERNNLFLTRERERYVSCVQTNFLHFDILLSAVRYFWLMDWFREKAKIIEI